MTERKADFVLPSAEGQLGYPADMLSRFLDPLPEMGWRCRRGWHRWKIKGAEHLRDPARIIGHFTLRCTRCGLETDKPYRAAGGEEPDG